MANIITINERAIIYPIDIDIHSKSSFPTVYSKQYEDGSRFIKVTLWDNGVIYPLLTTDTIYFAGTKSGNKGILVSTEDVSTYLFGIGSDGSIIYQIRPNDTATDTSYETEFRIYDINKTTKATPKFKMCIEKSALMDSTPVLVEEGSVVSSLMTITDNANKAYTDYIDATRENTDIAIINLRQDMLYIEPVENTTLIPLDAKLLDGYSSTSYRMKPDIFTATSNNTTVVTHNLTYDSNHDDLLVFYKGFLLDKDNDEYTENPDNHGITLSGWSISSGEKVHFKLYKLVK